MGLVVELIEQKSPELQSAVLVSGVDHGPPPEIRHALSQLNPDEVVQCRTDRLDIELRVLEAPLFLDGVAS